MGITAQERADVRWLPARSLAREPLLWAAVAAILGAAIGLAGNFRLVTWFGGMNVPGSPPPALVWLVPPAGELLATVSLIGVFPLLVGVRAARATGLLGVPPGLLLLVPFSGTAALQFGWLSLGGATQSGGPSAFYVAVLVLALCLPPIAVLPFALAAFVARKPRLGTVLLGLFALAIPHLMARQLVFGDALGAVPQEVAASVLLGGIGVGVSVLEAPLWTLFGVVLFRRARERARGKARREEERINCRAARRLYEVGLGAWKDSLVDDIVSDDFRHLRSGHRGKLGMERVFSALRKSYPDLEVSVEDQEAEADVVETRLTLSGTDEGGVMWYPPTGRRATFSAVFTDRFRDGRLVEHAGEADTESLLRQLGHTERGIGR